MKTLKNPMSHQSKSDTFWMKKSLELAQKAYIQDEVPVGALLVIQDKIIARAYNKKESWHTPLGHAELICIQRASQKLKRWRMNDATLYVTLEPCVMCAGLLVQARIGRLVYGANDPKGGGVTSLYQIPQDKRLNHSVDVVGGVLQEECSEILSRFFKQKRGK